MTRTLAEKIERRLNTLPVPSYWKSEYGEYEYYDRTLPNGHEIKWADGYAEPGYPQCEVVLLSNWNDQARYVKGPWREGLQKWVVLDDTASRLADSLSKLEGVEIDWYDEYAVCDECNKAFRTTADSYSWTMYGAWNGDGYSCGDCIKNDPESHIEDFIGEADKAITVLGENELELAGWVKVTNDSSYSGDYHSGWYGREDNPATIMSDLSDKFGDVVFVIEGTGQFETAFAPYVRASAVIDVLGGYGDLLERAQQAEDYNATH